MCTCTQWWYEYTCGCVLRVGVVVCPECKAKEGTDKEGEGQKMIDKTRKAPGKCEDHGGSPSPAPSVPVVLHFNYFGLFSMLSLIDRLSSFCVAIETNAAAKSALGPQLSLPSGYFQYPVQAGPLSVFLAAVSASVMSENL
ncbi:predicted protein [Histoplasma capsulatum var. duboisii H88]|uniref:Predicted protein n=2 Tax=Ajellomyces capsulatus TaxID=5037 RepID=F0UGD7_AJEC8|nr:predicted protein [Histoplasma capsulatum H143]EGC44290.1 predicted protein [Histoplasma capsulatum var. duboisii H88]